MVRPAGTETSAHLTLLPKVLITETRSAILGVLVESGEEGGKGRLKGGRRYLFCVGPFGCGDGVGDFRSHFGCCRVLSLLMLRLAWR